MILVINRFAIGTKGKEYFMSCWLQGNRLRSIWKKVWVVTPPATSRHMNRLLWLLPSGPDQVHKVSLREDQWSHHRDGPNELGGALLPNFLVESTTKLDYECV